LKSGDDSFANRLNYFSRNIKGSTPFWHAKRQEVYTWINHHVEKGNGAPNYFMTLSCGEHYWKDIIRLIKERVELAGENSTCCYVGSPKLSQLLNDYAIVVQEFFQKRVLAWLNTVGKKVCKINHYWVRYEFAPGRGQIHAHLLAIAGNNTLEKLCHLDLKHSGPEKRDERLSQWAEESFRMTACVDEQFDQRELNPHNSPCAKTFSDIDNQQLSRTEDEQNLMRFCQCHHCSGFCMRKNKSNR
jgi:hypothetical protein